MRAWRDRESEARRNQYIFSWAVVVLGVWWVAAKVMYGRGRYGKIFE
jgi:hypothetical protein